MDSLFARICLPFTLLIVSFLFGVANGTITPVERALALSFDDKQALFGPEIGEVQGLLHVVRPLDACNPLHNLLMNISNSNFALIKIGGCSVQQKIRTAQAAGFNATVMYNEYSDWVPRMEQNNEDIKIPAMFISRESGETLLEIAGDTGVGVKITLNDENEDYSPRVPLKIVALMVLFVELFVMLLILKDLFYWCFPLRTEPSNPEPPTCVQLPPRMSRNLVRALPCVVYNPLVEPNSTDTTCVVCMEDFTSGTKLRVLPCNHRFHKKCIDAWLTRWRAFCPICKHDSREKWQNPSASVSNHISITNQSSSSDTLQTGPYHGSLDALC